MFTQANLEPIKFFTPWGDCYANQSKLIFDTVADADSFVACFRATAPHSLASQDHAKDPLSEVHDDAMAKVYCKTDSSPMKKNHDYFLRQLRSIATSLKSQNTLLGPDSTVQLDYKSSSIVVNGDNFFKCSVPADTASRPAVMICQRHPLYDSSAAVAIRQSIDSIEFSRTTAD